MILLCENELFQRGWGGVGGGVFVTLVENYGGVRGSSAPYKNGKSRKVAGGVLSEIPSVVGVWILNHSMRSLLMNVACKESGVR